VTQAKAHVEQLFAQYPSLPSQADSHLLDTELLKPIVNELIQSALDTYSADVIAKPDYALGSAGASVLHYLTTESYKTLSTSFLGRLLKKKVLNGWGPYFALTPGTLPGQFWSMSGKTI
jgi:hypothetical protein